MPSIPILVTKLDDTAPGFTVRVDSDAWACNGGLPLIIPRERKLTIVVTANGLVSVTFESAGGA